MDVIWLCRFSSGSGAVSELCLVSYRMTYSSFFITRSSDNSRKNRLRRSLEGSVFCGAQISPFLPNLTTPPQCSPLSQPRSLHHLQEHRNGKTSSDEEELAHKDLSSLCHKGATKRAIFKRFLWTDAANHFDCSAILIILPHLILYSNPKDVNNIVNNVLSHLNYVMDVRYNVENILM